MEKFKFDYRRYKSKNISVEKLDLMFESIMKPGVSAIFTSIKIVAVFAYMWCRKRIIDEEHMIEKQEYEQERNRSNRDEINGEDMDGR